MSKITAKQQYWSEHLLQASTFEGTVSEYAQANNIPVQTLYRWRHYFKRTAGAEVKAKPVFTQLVRAPVINVSDYCISLQQGNTKIRFAQWPDPQWLVDFIAASHHS